MVLLLRKLYLYFTKDPEGVHYFPGGGGGPNANFYRKPYTYLLFSRGGSPDPPITLWIRTWQFHRNGTILITVPCEALIFQD